MFIPAHEQAFNAWKDTPGGGMVLRACYRKAARYARRYKKYGKRVSIRLIWELVRDHLDQVKAEAKAAGRPLKKTNGYAMNDHFHAYARRHIEERRPDWKGMFTEKRSVGKKRGGKRVIIIEDKKAS